MCCIYRYPAVASNLTSTLARANAGSGLRILRLPSSTLTPSTTYAITLTLTNFLGGTAIASGSIVVEAGGSIPSVAILPRTLTILRSTGLEMFADVTLPSCASIPTLSFKWSLNGVALPSSTTGTDTRYLRLPAHSLSSGAAYTIRVNVSDMVNASNTATASLTVLPSPLVVTLRGGSVSAIGVNRLLTLDASDSYDPDVAGSPTSAGLNFTWGCIQGGSEFGKACQLNATFSSTAVQQLGRLVPGIYIFTVAGRKGSRTASATRTVKVVTTPIPYVTIMPMEGNASRISSGVKLTLLGTATMNRSETDSPDLSFAWSIRRGSFQDGKSLTDVSRSVTIGGSYDFGQSSTLTLPRYVIDFCIAAATGPRSSFECLD